TSRSLSALSRWSTAPNTSGDRPRLVSGSATRPSGAIAGRRSRTAGGASRFACSPHGETRFPPWGPLAGLTRRPRSKGSGGRSPRPPRERTLAQASTSSPGVDEHVRAMLVVEPIQHARGHQAIPRLVGVLQAFVLEVDE